MQLAYHHDHDGPSTGTALRARYEIQLNLLSWLQYAYIGQNLLWDRGAISIDTITQQKK